jgi:hypothetical protein
MKYRIVITLLAISSACMAHPTVNQTVTSASNTNIIGESPTIAMSNIYTEASPQFDSRQTGEILKSSHPAELINEYTANSNLEMSGVANTPDYQ